MQERRSNTHYPGNTNGNFVFTNTLTSGMHTFANCTTHSQDRANKTMATAGNLGNPDVHGRERLDLSAIQIR
jgi:hypothetical protein